MILTICIISLIILSIIVVLVNSFTENIFGDFDFSFVSFITSFVILAVIDTFLISLLLLIFG